MERSSLHVTFKRLPQEQLRPLRKQWKFKSRDKFVFLKAMKDVLPRSVDEVTKETTPKRIEEAARIVRAGLVALGPTLLPVMIPSQAYDVILHDITKNRFDIMCDTRVVLDSAETDLRELNSEVRGRVGGWVPLRCRLSLVVVVVDSVGGCLYVVGSLLLLLLLLLLFLFFLLWLLLWLFLLFLLLCVSATGVLVP